MALMPANTKRDGCGARQPVQTEDQQRQDPTRSTPAWPACTVVTSISIISTGKYDAMVGESAETGKPPLVDLYTAYHASNRFDALARVDG